MAVRQKNPQTWTDTNITTKIYENYWQLNHSVNKSLQNGTSQKPYFYAGISNVLDLKFQSNTSIAKRGELFERSNKTETQ